MSEWDDRIDAPKDAHLARDFGTCFIRINNDAALKYVSQARTLAGIVANRMALAGVDSHAQRVALDDGTIITAQIGIGHTILTVDAGVVEEGGSQQVYWWDFCFIPRDADHLYSEEWNTIFRLGVDPLKLPPPDNVRRYFWRYHYPHAIESAAVKKLTFNPLHGNQFFVPAPDELYSWQHSSNGDLPMLRLHPSMFEFTKLIGAFPVDVMTRISVAVDPSEKLPCYTPLVAHVHLYQNGRLIDGRNLLPFGYFVEGPTHYQFFELFDASLSGEQDQAWVYRNNIPYYHPDFVESIKWIAGYGRTRLGDFCLFATDPLKEFGPVFYFVALRWTSDTGESGYTLIDIGTKILAKYSGAPLIIDRLNWPCRVNPDCTEAVWLIEACAGFSGGPVDPVVLLCRFAIDLTKGTVDCVEATPQTYHYVVDQVSTLSDPAPIYDPHNDGKVENGSFNNDTLVPTCYYTTTIQYDYMNQYIYTIDRDIGTVTTRDTHYVIRITGEPIIAVSYDAEGKLLTAKKELDYTYDRLVNNTFKAQSLYDHRKNNYGIDPGMVWNDLFIDTAWFKRKSKIVRSEVDCTGSSHDVQNWYSDSYHKTGGLKESTTVATVSINQADKLVTNNDLSLALVDLASTENNKSFTTTNDAFFYATCTSFREIINDSMYTGSSGREDIWHEWITDFETKDGSWISGTNHFIKQDKKVDKALIYLNLRHKIVVYKKTTHDYSRTLDGDFFNGNPSYIRKTNRRTARSHYINEFGDSPYYEYNEPVTYVQGTQVINTNNATYSWGVTYKAVQETCVHDWRKNDTKTLDNKTVYEYANTINSYTYVDLHDSADSPGRSRVEFDIKLDADWVFSAMDLAPSRSLMVDVFFVRDYTPYLYCERTKAARWMYPDDPAWYANLFGVTFPVQYHAVNEIDTNTPDNTALLAGLPLKGDELSLIPIGLVRMTDPETPEPGSVVAPLFPISITEGES